MFDTRKFGSYLAKLRKESDMTQSELGDRLGVTRQAISRYEHGESFPDVSILVLIADIFSITVDKLIMAGEPTRGEAKILEKIALGKENTESEELGDIINIAPLLKPSVLGEVSARFAKQGIDISGVVALAEYLNDADVYALLENVTFDEINDELLEKFLPLLDRESKYAVFEKLMNGELDYHFIRAFLPYAENMISQIEAAVMEGALPEETLGYISDYINSRL